MEAKQATGAKQTTGMDNLVDGCHATVIPPLPATALAPARTLARAGEWVQECRDGTPRAEIRVSAASLD